MLDPESEVVYRCIFCRDSGWVHPRKKDGYPDYSQVKPCPRCRQPKVEQQASLPLSESV